MVLAILTQRFTEDCTQDFLWTDSGWRRTRKNRNHIRNSVHTCRAFLVSKGPFWLSDCHSSNTSDPLFLRGSWHPEFPLHTLFLLPWSPWSGYPANACANACALFHVCIYAHLASKRFKEFFVCLFLNCWKQHSYHPMLPRTRLFHPKFLLQLVVSFSRLAW